MPRARSVDKLHRDKIAGRHWKSKKKTELLKLMNQPNTESMKSSELTSKTKGVQDAE